MGAEVAAKVRKRAGPKPPLYPDPTGVARPSGPVRLDPGYEKMIAEAVPELLSESSLGLKSINRQLQRSKSTGVAYEPTFNDRALVAIWAAVGTPAHVIACELGISEATVWKYFGDELKDAEARGVARVATRLYAKALDGDNTSMIFYLKTRGRWRDADKAPGSDADNPLHVQMSVVQDMLKRARVIKQSDPIEGRLLEQKGTLSDAEDVL